MTDFNPCAHCGGEVYKGVLYMDVWVTKISHKKERRNNRQKLKKSKLAYQSKPC